MSKFIWADSDAVFHDFIDERDDHRILIARCGAETWWSRRMNDHWSKPQPSITCLLCLMEELS